MEDLADKTLEQFLQELNSASPTPGGGAVAGICGAMAAALAGMVAHLTLGKKKYVQVQPEMEELVQEATSCQKQMVELAAQDELAFNIVMAAYTMPKQTEAEQSARKESLQKACKKAALVPLETAKLCVKIMRLAQQAALKGNRMVVTDAAAAGLLARAALRISSYNVRINMNSIEDRSFNTDIGTQLNRQEHHGAVLESAIIREADQVLLKN